eukprot:NODE_249_length_12946_cov_0.357438.p5 type:complete len:365 gc:universal NODE_249_length_12946_cov_0.357438:12769-11675(-)
MGITDKIKDIEYEMSRTQKNKATEHHLGSLKAKLAKLRQELLEDPKSSGKGEGFDVQKSGVARVAMLGFPSVGKSTLLSKLTSTESLVASYEFTTLTAIPGKLKLHGTEVQLLDLPGIIQGAAQGKGRGRQVCSIIRTADLVLFMLDASKDVQQMNILLRELEYMGIRINKEPPNIYIKQKQGGGIYFNATCKCIHLNDKIISSILKDQKIHHAEVICHGDYTVDEFVDVLVGGRRYIRGLFCYNKIDSVPLERVEELASQENSVVISCEFDLNLDYLLECIWYHLDLIRVYTKRKGEYPDFENGFVVKRSTSVQHICKMIHKSLEEEFKCALVWGCSTRHSPQQVGIQHILEDEDVIQILKTI